MLHRTQILWSTLKKRRKKEILNQIKVRSISFACIYCPEQLCLTSAELQNRLWITLKIPISVPSESKFLSTRRTVGLNKSNFFSEVSCFLFSSYLQVHLVKIKYINNLEGVPKKSNRPLISSTPSQPFCWASVKDNQLSLFLLILMIKNMCKITHFCHFYLSCQL